MTSSEEGVLANQESNIAENPILDVKDKKDNSLKLAKKAKIMEKMKKRRERRAILNNREDWVTNCQEALDASLPKYNWLEEKIQRQCAKQVSEEVQIVREDPPTKKPKRGRKPRSSSSSSKTKQNPTPSRRKSRSRRAKKLKDLDEEQSPLDPESLARSSSLYNQPHSNSSDTFLLDDSGEVEIIEIYSPALPSEVENKQQKSPTPITKYKEPPRTPSQDQLRLPLKKRLVMKAFHDTNSNIDDRESPLSTKRNRSDEIISLVTNECVEIDLTISQSPSPSPASSASGSAALSDTYPATHSKVNDIQEKIDTKVTYSVLSFLSSTSNQPRDFNTDPFSSRETYNPQHNNEETSPSISRPTSTSHVLVGQNGSSDDASPHPYVHCASTSPGTSSAFYSSHLSPCGSPHSGAPYFPLSSPISHHMDPNRFANLTQHFPSSRSASSSMHEAQYLRIARFLPPPRFDFNIDGTICPMAKILPGALSPPTPKMQPVRPIAIRFAPMRASTSSDSSENSTLKNISSSSPQHSQMFWNRPPSSCSSPAPNVSAFAPHLSPYHFPSKS